MGSERADRIRDLLWPKGSGADVWAIVDGARHHKIHWLLVNSHLKYSCLYSGRIPDALEAAAPYLVQLYYDDGFTEQLLRDGWGDSWGVFLKCDATMERLRRHLRGFLIVRDPAGKRLAFRYYDPRVLRVYLPTCDSSELQTVYGPIECFWTEADDPDSLLQFKVSGNKLSVTKSSIVPVGAPKSPKDGARAHITADRQTMVVQKKIDVPARSRIVLKIDGKLPGPHAMFSRSSANIVFFDAIEGGREVTFAGNVAAIPAAQLRNGKTIYAEARGAGEVTLQLDPVGGEKAVCSITAVQLTMEVQGPGGLLDPASGVHLPVPESGQPANRLKIVVHPVNPPSFAGKLVLGNNPDGGQVRLFAQPDGGDNLLAPEHEFAANSLPAEFWIEAGAPSNALNDAALRLSVAGRKEDADSIAITAVRISNLRAEIPVTPSRTARIPATGRSYTWTPKQSSPLVLLAGSLGDRAPVVLRADIQPPDAPLEWSVARAADDAPDVIGKSANPLPAIKPRQGNRGEALLMTGAAGSFQVHATAGGVSMAKIDLVLVHARLVKDETQLTSKYCICAKHPLRNELVLQTHGGAAGQDCDDREKAPVRFQTLIELVGGGPDGRRGLDQILGGWINNLVSNNSGATYSPAGKTAASKSPAAKTPLTKSPMAKGGAKTPGDFGRVEYRLANQALDLTKGPLLDTGRPGSEGLDCCLSTSAPETDLLSAAESKPACGCIVRIAAHEAPGVSWRISHPRAAGCDLDHLWTYAQFRTYLCLWSKAAPGLFGVLMEMGWALTGDYECKAAKPVKTVAKLKVASDAVVKHPGLVPAASTGIEVWQPTTAAAVCTVDSSGVKLPGA